VQLAPEIGYGDRLKPRLDRIATYNVRHVDVVGSISSSVRADLESMGATARIVDIPNGVSWDDFQTGPSTMLRDRLGLPGESHLVLSVGRNHIKKAYDLGIRAFARVAADIPHAHYALVGRNTTSFESLVAELNLQGRVHLVEQVPMSDMPSVYHSADVFFNPSMVEGFAQVNAQALACGLPCVLTDAPGNRDAGDNGGALIGKSGVEESLAENLKRLLTDGQLRARLSAEASQAGKKYAWSFIAQQYLNIFAELVDRSEQSRPMDVPKAAPGSD
jgi:glycosyltransferase involved in cell wall biosynthesis